MKKKAIYFFLAIGAMASSGHTKLVDKSELNKITNLRIMKGVKPGYWVVTKVSEPANNAFPPSKEEGCVDRSGMVSSLTEKMTVCDIPITEDRDDRATAYQCDGSVKIEFNKLLDDKYMVTSTLPDKTQLIQNYQRLSSCKVKK